MTSVSCSIVTKAKIISSPEIAEVIVIADLSGGLLETKPQNVVIDSEVLNQYLVAALEITPLFESKMLVEYNGRRVTSTDD